jgi:SEC-C motif-containing protein
MRSRYCAYVKGLAPYLLRTWDPSTRPVELDLDPTLRWSGLEVLRVVDGGDGDPVGTVEFVAHHERGGVRGALHEVSRFRRRDAQWVYLDGDT